MNHLKYEKLLARILNRECFFLFRDPTIHFPSPAAFSPSRVNYIKKML